MTLSHLPNWRALLDAYILERLRQPFAWGVNDCALFAAGAVLATTGRDPAAELRGSYTTGNQAMRIIRAHGGLQAIATRALGHALAPTYACLGDVVMLLVDGREALGVVINSQQVAGPGADGLHVAPLSDALWAWRVG